MSFLWNSTRGARLQPWRSPYLRWRMETYTGMHADEIGPKQMFAFLWKEKWQFLRFLRWTGEMRQHALRESGGRDA